MWYGETNQPILIFFGGSKSTMGSLMGLKKRAGASSAWLSYHSWPRRLGAGTPLPISKEEIGVQPLRGTQGRTRTRQSPNSGEGWVSRSSRERCNTGNLVASSHVDGIIWSIYFTVSDWWSMCVNPEIHISPQAKEGRKGIDRSRSLFYFVPQGYHSQAGSTREGMEWTLN